MTPTLYNMDSKFSHKFGKSWVEDWNSHDLAKILLHYTDDFELSSPIIKQLANEPSGILKGKDAIRCYWKKALEKHPNLKFEFINAYSGVNSIAVHYKGHRGLSMEVFHFDTNSKVNNAYAHYELL